MQMILNELSASFPVDAIQDGQKIMEMFLETYFKVKNIIHNDAVLMDKDYKSFELARGYRIEQWRNDGTVDVEIKRKFRHLLNKSVVYNSQEFEQDKDCEFTINMECGEVKSQGCLLAYLQEGIAVSFLSDEYWERSDIQGTYLELTEEGEIKQSQIQVPNVSCESNIEAFKITYECKRDEWRYENIKSGQSILDCVEKVFSNLVFCESAIEGCKRNVGVSEAGQVYKRLLELQRAAESMEDKFDKSFFAKATPETQETLKRFEQEHTFLLPDGSKQLFSWHTRYTGGYAGRIFFHPDPKGKQIYVGHIGHKLPTVRYH